MFFLSYTTINQSITTTTTTQNEKRNPIELRHVRALTALRRKSNKHENAL